MLSAPRLDRPSAIGDDGRPRATSLGIAAVVVCLLVGVSGFVLGEPTLLPTLATLAGLTAAGIALLDREGFVDVFVGHVLLLIFGSVLAGVVFLAPFVSSVGWAISGFTIALTGVALGWADVGNETGARRTAAASAITVGSVVVSLVVLSIAFSVVAIFWELLSELAVNSSPAGSVVSVLLVTIVSAGVFRLSLRWLPLRQLAPSQSRPTVEAATARAHRLTRVLILGASIGVLATFVLGMAGIDRRIDSPALEWALSSLSSWPVLGFLLAVGLSSLLVGVCSLCLRAATRYRDRHSRRHLSAFVLGSALGALLVVSVAGLSSFPAMGIALFVLLALFVALVGMLALCCLAILGLIGTEVNLLPDRAGPAALAAAGLLLAAIGLRHGPPALVFACVTGAVIVWDVSSFGLGLTAELGHIPETRRLELVHGVLVVGVGIVTLLTVVGLEALRTSSVAADVGGTLALLVAALGALVLLIPLRG